MPRASSQPLNLSLEEMLDLEYVLCARDFWYWFENYGWMKNEEEGLLIGPGVQLWPTLDKFPKHLRSLGLQELDSYQGQTEFVDLVLAGDSVWAGKGRRQGVSWIMSNIETWDMMFHENISQGIMAQDDEKSMLHLGRDRFIYNQQPEYLKRAVPVIGLNSKHEFGLSNGSVISAWPSTSASARGAGRKRIRLEEVAFWQNPEEAWAGLTAATGQIVGVSTGNGEEGLFHDKWQKPGKLRLWFMPWFGRPGRTAEWYQEQRDLLGEALCRQEYPSVPEDMFLASGTKYWDPILVRGLRDKYECIPAETSHGGTWRIYDYPEKGRLYVVGADVADGGGDACCASVLDVETGYQVAKVSSHVWDGDHFRDHRWSADGFADHLMELGRLYNWAFLGVERNNMGHATLSTLLRTLEYPEDRIYHHEEWDKDSDSKQLRPGWITNKTSRPVLLGDIRRDTEQLDVIVQDGLTYKQMVAFGYYSGRWQHPPSQQDDEVFALGIAQQIRKVILEMLRENGELSVYRGEQRIA